ncbi:hypothetical protein K491DRAFT_677788 [Lophiostoma macrostomum CBS 122681]|uniref:Uncharacterized protein n=1 Tax=Lophiostoma macrostomum CBS 122681 TaxID=1314788 RepID=A0A6A6TA38_9PLEO|nr:hypothetical protein K491DRAFT_677788 [Lophiostoma macrostomum CBS 122681]
MDVLPLALFPFLLFLLFLLSAGGSCSSPNRCHAQILPAKTMIRAGGLPVSARVPGIGGQITISHAPAADAGLELPSIGGGLTSRAAAAWRCDSGKVNQLMAAVAPRRWGVGSCSSRGAIAIGVIGSAEPSSHRSHTASGRSLKHDVRLPPSVQFAQSRPLDCVRTRQIDIIDGGGMKPGASSGSARNTITPSLIK